MKKLLVLTLLSAAATSALLTSCETTSNSSPDRFAKADTNKDAKLSPDESSDYFVTTLFGSRDSNQDGNLTWEEWNGPGGGQGKARFEAADTNKNGSLGHEEALAYGRARGLFKEDFRAADKNRDGFVTREEAQAHAGSREGPVR